MEWNTDSSPAAGLGATLILIISFLHDPFWIILNYHLCRSQWTTSLDPITEAGELLVTMSFPGQDDHMCPFTIPAEGRGRKRLPRGSLDATHIPPCPLWCLLIARSRASTQWELLSLYHILWSRRNLTCSGSRYSVWFKGVLAVSFLPTAMEKSCQTVWSHDSLHHSRTWCRAISCFRHHSKLAVHHDTYYPGYRRILQNLQ